MPPFYKPVYFPCFHLTRAGMVSGWIRHNIKLHLQLSCKTNITQTFTDTKLMAGKLGKFKAVSSNQYIQIRPTWYSIWQDQVLLYQHFISKIYLISNNAISILNLIWRLLFQMQKVNNLTWSWFQTFLSTWLDPKCLVFIKN